MKISTIIADIIQIINRSHDDLQNLNADDHTGYHTDARADTYVKGNIEVGDLKSPTKALAMNNQKITGLAAPAAAGDAARKSEVDAKMGAVSEDGSPSLGGELNASSNKIINLAAPAGDNDAARKVDLGTVIPDFLPGNVWAVRASTERDTNEIAYVTVKEFYLGRGGTIRVRFGLKGELVGTVAYARVYRNGSPIGTEQTVTGTVWEDKFEDISGWTAGETLTLKYHGTDGDRAYVKECLLGFVKTDVCIVLTD